MQVEPTKYRQFPFAISAPKLMHDEVLVWLRERGLFFNQHYLCYEKEPDRRLYSWQQRKQPTVYAFKDKAHMIMFKLVMAG